ncbi:MAG: hypothetical protein VX836_14395 [Pseudomonadota bacterium]|nr:hypothetical protein [Pseudomonadota bacterium]
MRTTDEFFSLVGDLLPEYEKCDKTKGSYYRALSEFLEHRLIEFDHDYPAFVVAHYFLIMDHIFAPASAVREMGVMESLLAINRSHVLALHHFPANERQREGRFPWFPMLKEIFTGIDFMARLYTVDQSRVGSGSRFKKLVLAYSNLNSSEVEALWQFRCGMVHSGTLYNVSEKGVIYRFRADVFQDDRAIYEPPRSLAYLAGRRFHVNLRVFHRLYEDAQMFLHKDMKTNVQKYAFSSAFHDWIRTHWTLSYLPSHDELANLESRMQSQGIAKHAPSESAHSQVILARAFDPRLISDHLLRWRNRVILRAFRSHTDR